MIAQLPKDIFKKGLQLVERITGKNVVLPILNNVLLSAKDSFLKLVTTDLEIAIQHFVLAKIEKEGEITVPAKVISNFVSYVPENNLTLQSEKGKLKISGETYQTEIKGLEPKDFPIIPKIEKNEFVEVNPSVFTEGIMQVIDFCAVTQTRPELSGVYFSFNKNECKIVATDSFRLAEKTLFFEKPQETIKKEVSLILPRNAAKEVVNLFQDAISKIKVYFSPNQILFESYFADIDHPQTQLISRLIEGEFPAYQEIIPKESKTNLVLSRDQFIDYLKATSIFAGRGNEVKIGVLPKKNEVEIFSENAEVGSGRFRMPAQIEGEKVEVCFNYKFLLEGINKIKTSEIFIGLNGEEGPAIVKAPSDTDFIYIVMPIKPT